MSELQMLLNEYLKDHPERVQVLADEYRTAKGTITRWANGHSSPAQSTNRIIISDLKRKLNKSQ